MTWLWHDYDYEHNQPTNTKQQPTKRPTNQQPTNYDPYSVTPPQPIPIPSTTVSAQHTLDTALSVMSVNLSCAY
jgi:hypothetical protein